MVNEPICPRCGGFIPNDITPGKYPGAISHHDNSTEICSACGDEEDLFRQSGIPLSGPDDWNQRGGHLPGEPFLNFLNTPMQR